MIFFFLPPPFLGWSRSINNLHNFTTSIFNVPAKGLLLQVAASLGLMFTTLKFATDANSPKGVSLVCVLTSVCLSVCMHNEECLCV